MKHRNTLQDGRQGCAVVQVGRRSAGGEMEFEWLRVNVVVYIEGYYFGFIEILRIRGLSMCCFVLHSLRNQNKNKKKFAADAVGW